MSRKDSERFYLENFLKLLGETPTRIKDSESPDFIVTLCGKKIGIEVTEFHSDLKGVYGRPRRAIEATWELLQKNLKKAVEECPELKGTYGRLMFKGLIAPPRAKHKDFIDELIQLSLTMICTNCEEIKPDKIKFPLLYHYLEKFYLKRIYNSHYISWDWNKNGSSIGLAEYELINAIQAKTKKVGRYKRKEIEELWLLIVSGNRLSQAMPPSPFIEYKLRNYGQLNKLLRLSGYDKVYLYQMFNGIYEWSELSGWVKLENFSLG